MHIIPILTTNLIIVMLLKYYDIKKENENKKIKFGSPHIKSEVQ